MFLSSTLFLAASLVTSCLAADPPVRSQFNQINSDFAYIARTLTYLDGYIKNFTSEGATNYETVNIWNFIFEVVDDSQNAYTSVRFFNISNGAFYASESQLLSGTVDGLVPTLDSVLKGLVEKKEELKSVGMNGSPETLVTQYHDVLVSAKTSTDQLYSLTTQLSPDPIKQHFEEISKEFASDFDTAIAGYTE